MHVYTSCRHRTTSLGFMSFHLTAYINSYTFSPVFQRQICRSKCRWRTFGLTELFYHLLQLGTRLWLDFCRQANQNNELQEAKGFNKLWSWLIILSGFITTGDIILYIVIILTIIVKIKIFLSVQPLSLVVFICIVENALTMSYYSS